MSDYKLCDACDGTGSVPANHPSISNEKLREIVRAMVAEELAKLQEEDEEPFVIGQKYDLVKLPDSGRPSATIAFSYEGKMYRGTVYAVKGGEE